MPLASSLLGLFAAVLPQSLPQPIDAPRPAPPAAKEPPSTSASVPPVISSWRVTPESMPIPVIEAIARWQEGHLVLLGGIDSTFAAVSTIQIRDPRRGWLPIGSQLSAARASASCVTLDEHRVLVLGGFEGGIASPQHHEDGEVLDPLVAGSGRTTPSFGASLEGHIATSLGPGRVLVTAGDTARIYDAVLDLWSPPAALDPPRRYHVAVALDSQHVLMLGGETTPAGDIADLTATLVFAPQPSGTDALPPPEAEPFPLSGSTGLPWGTRHLAAARCQRGPGSNPLLLLAGGFDPATGRSVRECCWIDTDLASARAAPPLPAREGATQLHLVPIDHGVAAVGGEWRSPEARGAVDLAAFLEVPDGLDPGAWRPLQPLPVSATRRMRLAETSEWIGGYRFLTPEEAAMAGRSGGAIFDTRRYRLSVSPAIAGD